MKILTLTEESKTDILENLLKRSPNSYGKFESQVAEIIENVRAKKDAALFDYTRRFDSADINPPIPFSHRWKSKKPMKMLIQSC